MENAVSLGCLLAAVWCAPALARPCQGETHQIDFLGWAEDGHSLAYEIVVTSMETGGSDCTEYTVQKSVVVDALTGKTREYQKRFEGSQAELQPLKARYAKLAPADDFRAWRTAHRLTAPRDGPPGYALSVKPDFKSRRAGAVAKGNSWAIDVNVEEDDSGYDVEKVTYSLAVERDGKTLSRWHWKPAFCHVALMGKVEARWSPDGRRVAWIATQKLCMGILHTRVWVEPAGPTVEFRGDASRLDAVLELAAKRLEAAGFAPTRAAPIEEHRKTTIVYAAKGFEADAARIVTAFGVGEVRPFDWKSEVDLLIAGGEDLTASLGAGP
jgi:hypothetical protein